MSPVEDIAEKKCSIKPKWSIPFHKTLLKKNNSLRENYRD